jgi:Asp-tRNA(Asn)/Glu-tRNA(Gln) amidotransferase A subunit family amidase
MYSYKFRLFSNLEVICERTTEPFDESFVSKAIMLPMMVTMEVIINSDHSWLFTWASSALIGALMLRLITGLSQKKERRSKLKQIAQKAVHEVRSLEQACLAQPALADVSAVYTIKETQDLLKRKSLTPARNVLNLAKRCRKYGRGKVNAITEELYDEAYETALKLEKSTESGTKSPLYGIAISVKECINSKGHYASAGLACRMGQRCEKDALIVSVLKKAGAIPLCHGNVPQLLMSCECDNRVWGRTNNPWDLSRVPGGSTGGDAALVAMRCVPLAVGSDVAGSCRIPASFCGIVGLKTTSGRLSLKGAMKPRKDNKAGSAITIPTVVGPLSRTVDDCATFMKTVCVPDFWNNDLSLPQLPFDNVEYMKSSPMKIGYFKSDDFFAPCAAAKRGLEKTIAALEKAGHTLVPFELPMNGWETNRLLVGINAADGNMRCYEEGLEGEEFVDQFKFLQFIANLPNVVRFGLKKVVDKRRSFLLGCASKLSIECVSVDQRYSDAYLTPRSIHGVWRSEGA